LHAIAVFEVVDHSQAGESAVEFGGHIQDGYLMETESTGVILAQLTFLSVFFCKFDSTLRSKGKEKTQEKGQRKSVLKWSFWLMVLRHRSAEEGERA